MKHYYYIEWKHAENEGKLRIAEYYKEMYRITVMNSQSYNWYVKKLKQFPMIYLN